MADRVINHFSLKGEGLKAYRLEVKNKIVSSSCFHKGSLLIFELEKICFILWVLHSNFSIEVK